MEVLSWRELVARTGSPEQARWEVEHEEWTRVLRGAYVSADVPVTRSVRLAALRRVLPDGVVVAGRTALWVYGCVEAPDTLDLVVGPGRHLVDRPGVRVLSAHLPEEEVCDLGAIVVQSAARACVDVLREERAPESVVVVDQVLRHGAADRAGLDASLARAAGLRGVIRARASAALVSGRSESPMETRLRLKLLRGGLQDVLVQQDVYDRSGHVGRADLAVDGVLVEFDGRRTRLDYDVFVGERRRQTRIAETQLELRRFTASDVYQRPDAALVAEVVRAQRLAAGRDRSLVLPGPDTLPAPKHQPLATRATRRAA